MLHPSDRIRPPAGACRHLGTTALLAAFAAVGLLAGAPPAAAQWGDTYDAPHADPYYSPPRRRARDVYREGEDGYGGRPSARRYAPPAQEAPRQFYWPWEERPQQVQPAPAPPSARPPRMRPPSAPPPGPSAPAITTAPDESRSARKRRPRPAPAVAQPKPVVPKAAPTTQIAVFGDSLASYLGKGLDVAFEDRPDVGVVDRSRGDSGLVRKDVLDWTKTAEEYLKANPKVSYALVMLGLNDRQPIREEDQTHEPLSDKWREIYAGRVDALVRVFAERKVPLIWVGLPPVRSETLATDFSAINDLVRERVRAAGQTYADIWPGFVDDRNRYAASGPDLDGQDAKLRTTDGIHFTGAGARKVAHFADVELKRLMGGAPGLQEAPTVATPAPGGASEPAAAGVDDTAAIDRRITAMLPSLPEPPGIPTLPVKPAAGPVVPLGRAELSPGGVLINARPAEGDAAATMGRSLRRGAAPVPQPGRADDFRWPPG